MVYVDRSGSFDASKTALAEKTLKDILQVYRANVDRDVLYFSDRVFKYDSRDIGGGTSYESVWDSIVKDPAEVAVVITDSDPARHFRRLARWWSTILEWRLQFWVDIESLRVQGKVRGVEELT